ADVGKAPRLRVFRPVRPPVEVALVVDDPEVLRGGTLRENRRSARDTATIPGSHGLAERAATPARRHGGADAPVRDSRAGRGGGAWAWPGGGGGGSGGIPPPRLRGVGVGAFVAAPSSAACRSGRGP